MMVYLLWSGKCGGQWLEEIFANKIDAEALIRQFKAQDTQIGTTHHYWIQEKKVQS